MTFENQKPLSTELKELFTDEDKNYDMMHNECVYDPTYVPSWGEDKTPICRVSGYGKELDQMSVSFEEMDSYGGEDQGSEFWCVWEFTRGDEVVRFKFEGWYASYDGATFERVFEVRPVQKTVTVWQ